MAGPKIWCLVAHVPAVAAAVFLPATSCYPCGCLFHKQSQQVSMLCSQAAFSRQALFMWLCSLHSLVGTFFVVCPLVALGACCSAACVRSQDLQLQAVHAAIRLCLCEVGYMLGVHLQHGGACSSSCRTTARSYRHGGVRGGAAGKECAHIMESVPGCVGDGP